MTDIFWKHGILMRKWTPLQASADDEWQVIEQIVVPQKFHPEILSLAHDKLMAGHLGVSKTHDRILRHFFFFFGLN